MKIVEMEQNSDEWLDYRKGKITGTTLRQVTPKTRGSGKKIGFYQLIADHLAVADDDDGNFADDMDKAHRRETEALEIFSELEGVKVERVGMCVSDFDPRVTNSPDGLIKKGKKYTEGVEVKCLSSARHLEAFIEQRSPVEFTEQFLQYFIVNDDLERLHVVFYDPRILSKQLFSLTIERKDIEDKLEAIKQYQLDTLKEVDEWVERLAF